MNNLNKFERDEDFNLFSDKHWDEMIKELERKEIIEEVKVDVDFNLFNEKHFDELVNLDLEND